MTELGTPRYAGFMVRTECTSCGMPLPLDRPTRQVECSQCHATIDIPAEVWRETLYLFEGDAPPPPGRMHTHNITVQSFPLQIQVANVAPACEQCGTAFPVDELPPGTAQNFACVSCGDPASSFGAPGWLQATVRTAQHLYTVDPRAEIPTGAEMAAVDVEGLIVVRAGDALLVCPKASAERVKEIVEVLRTRGMEAYL